MYTKLLILICTLSITKIEAMYLDTCKTQDSHKSFIKFIKLWEKKKYDFFKEYPSDNSIKEDRYIPCTLDDELCTFMKLYNKQVDEKEITSTGIAIITAIYNQILKKQLLKILDYMLKNGAISELIYNNIHSQSAIYIDLEDHFCKNYPLNEKGALLKHIVWENTNQSMSYLKSIEKAGIFINNNVCQNSSFSNTIQEENSSNTDSFSDCSDDETLNQSTNENINTDSEELFIMEL